VRFLQIKADGLDLDKRLEMPINLDGEVAIRATDGVLRCDIRILVVPEHIGQHVLDDRYGICFANVTSSRGGQDRLIAFEANDKTLRDFLRYGSHSKSPFGIRLRR